MPGNDTTEVRDRLRAAFAWRGDRSNDSQYADVTGFWRDAKLLRSLGPVLAALYPGTEPTVVLGPDSRGSLVGCEATHGRCLPVVD